MKRYKSITEAIKYSKTKDGTIIFEISSIRTNMSKYKSKLNENTNIFISNYDKRKIIDTHHSIQRAIERNIAKDALLKTINNGIERILHPQKGDTHTSDMSANYVIYSLSTKIPVAIEWRKDYSKETNPGLKDKKNAAIIMTVIPKKGSSKDVHVKNKSDIKLVVENFLRDEFTKLTRKKENREIYSGKDEIDVWHINMKDTNGIYITFYEGKLHDDSIYDYLIVD